MSDNHGPYAIGDVIGGRYRIINVLGTGAMGYVYGTEGVTGNWHAAVKVLRRIYAKDHRANARFHREAMLSSQLQSRHVARVYEAGMTADGLPFLAMEYLVGSDLSQLLEHYEYLPYAYACNYIIQSCNAVGEAHKHAIVHRDIKPSNLYLAATHDGNYMIKVLDFGVSKVRDSTTGGGLTRPGEMCGSPLYMAPEQINSAHAVDHRADIWSLGIVLYELLCGDSPVERDDLVSTILAIARCDIAPIEEKVMLPEGLAAIVHGCLAHDPDHRYPNIGVLALDLARFAQIEQA